MFGYTFLYIFKVHADFGFSCILKNLARTQNKNNNNYKFALWSTVLNWNRGSWVVVLGCLLVHETKQNKYTKTQQGKITSQFVEQ